MKIAFDENLPPQLVKVFTVLASEGDIFRAQFVSARDYALPKAKTDVPWLSTFASDGGTVVISGDPKMRGKLVERKALADLGLITVFFHGRWGQMRWHAKTAMLIKWWPVIEKTLRTAKRSQSFEIPCSWNGDKLEAVTTPGGVRKKPGPRKKSEQAIRE